MNPTATGMTNTATTEVIQKYRVFFEDTANDSTSFTEWDEVPASLLTEMALCIQEINRATARLQEPIKRTVPGNCNC